MKLYRYSPMANEEDLGGAIGYIHMACHELCKDVIGRYLPADNIVGVFSHYEDEYEKLLEVQARLVKKEESVNGKYFLLKEKIIIPAQHDIPETIYKYLYIRRADPYRSQVGDMDFIMEDDEFAKLKSDLPKGARLFYRPELDMVELYDPDRDVLAYVKKKR